LDNYEGVSVCLYPGTNCSPGFFTSQDLPRLSNRSNHVNNCYYILKHKF
jgi:hypothetical protein